MDAVLEKRATQTFAGDEPLMRDVLSVYFDNTRYLVDAEIESHGDPADGGVVSAACEFAIPESCYIDATGHFNSVEFNICYNQMLYYSVAKSVKHGLMKAFETWTLDTFFKKQLPDILIIAFQSKFRRPIDSQRFRGEIDFVHTRLTSGTKPLQILKTNCRFHDANNGKSEGSVDLAIVDPLGRG